MVNVADKQRKSGILIPDAPPQNEQEFSKSGQDGAIEYYMFAKSSKESYKATYDILLGPDSKF